MWPRNACFLAITCLALTAAVPQGGSWAAGEVPGKKAVIDVSALIEAIHSDSFAQRQKATDAMLRLAPDERTVIENALAKERDADAIARLTKVALHLFLKDPRQTPLQGAAGLLGIALAAEDVSPATKADLRVDAAGQTAIVVLETKPGFPAYEVLRPGDRIVLLEDEPLSLGFNVEAFRAYVSAKAPGTMINMTILRDGRKLKVPVQVAGLQHPGESFLINFVERRALVARNYLQQLRPGSTTSSLVIHDDTPSDVGLNNQIGEDFFGN